VAKRKKPDASTQGTLFGPADVYGGAPAIPAPPPAAPGPSRWDDGLTPPTADELAALRAAHPGAMLLFRHVGGCAFHGDDALVAHRVAGLALHAADLASPYAGWRHGDFPGPMRLLLAAGHRVCVVERGEGLPPRHRLDAPVVTEFTEVPREEEGG
jgi:hypothetical protein